jgi:hypothetical protein
VTDLDPRPPDRLTDERPSERLRATLPFVRRDNNSNLPDLLDAVLTEIAGLYRQIRALTADRDMEAASFRRLADAVCEHLATDDDDDDAGEDEILVGVVERVAGELREARSDADQFERMFTLRSAEANEHYAKLREARSEIEHLTADLASKDFWGVKEARRERDEARAEVVRALADTQRHADEIRARDAAWTHWRAEIARSGAWDPPYWSPDTDRDVDPLDDPETRSVARSLLARMLKTERLVGSPETAPPERPKMWRDPVNGEWLPETAGGAGPETTPEPASDQ